MWERQGVGADAAPAFDTLVGKTLELRWKYFDEGKPVRGRFLAASHSMGMHMIAVWLFVHRCTSGAPAR